MHRSHTYIVPLSLNFLTGRKRKKLAPYSTSFSFFKLCSALSLSADVCSLYVMSLFPSPPPLDRKREETEECLSTSLYQGAN